ncbi:MAG: DUF3800 domain-containing protein [Rhizobiaceae bacterium]
MFRQNEGKYIFYADESGDHSLTSVDPTYPVFVLALCGFSKSTYCSRIVPKFQRLKFAYFGHDATVLHERDIRKQVGDFRILNNSEVRASFMRDLSTALESSPFRISATVIYKPELRQDLFPENPYAISLRICLQQAFRFLSARNEVGKRTYFVFEKRGAREDADLELEFRRLVDGENDLGMPLEGFNIHFSDKRANSTGMQIADLTARPIGLKMFRPGQPNRAFDLIVKKIYRNRKFSRPSRGIHIPEKRKASDYSEA